MTEIFDALEFCLQEMERGADLDSVLARFPEHADELRPILKTAAKARSMVSAEPPPDVVRRSRAKVMQRAAELREATAAPSRRAIPVFSRLAISFALTALFLASGAGLVNASASALPGENLYPVKRGWESIRLFFIFDPQLRNMLEDEYENERLHEVNELLAEGRHEVIQFAGVYMQVNGIDYVSGLKVILPEGVQAPANGSAVIVTGRTNAQGFIELSGVEILPEGSVVPLGSPIEMEREDGSESDEESASDGGSGSGSGGEAGSSSQPEEYELSGILQVISEGSLLVNGMPIVLDQTKVEGQLCVGMEVEVIGYYADDGSFIALEIEGEGQCAEEPSSGGSNDNSGSSGGSSGDENGGDDNSNSSGDSNDNDSGGDDNGGDDNGDDSGDDGDDDDDDGDNSGSGGGDDDD